MNSALILLLLMLNLETAPLYKLDVQTLNPGPLPADLQVTSGEFVVKQQDDKRFIELTPIPIDSYGLLFGDERGESTVTTIRTRSWNTGKRFPEIAVATGGVSGYRLWLVPAMREIQIRLGNEVLARAPFDWKSGEWTCLRIAVEKSAQDRWLIGGSAWRASDAAPEQWMVQHVAEKQPPTGRSSVWASPYSEKPVQFDQFEVRGER